MNKRWITPSATSQKLDIPATADKLEVCELLVRLLAARGLPDASAMDAYLNPGLRHLAQPDDFPGMTEASQALAQGLAEGRRFAVWGDYDVDGVSSTAMVLDFMAARGIDARHHIPERRSEGYGLNIEHIERLAGAGITLLLTVDCGISDHEAISRANELGMQVVVSDHHEPGEQLPPARAIANPKLGPCPCPSLAGAGVVFFLLGALNRLLPGEPLDMRRFLDLAALGTIADVVKLTGQNRILVKNGLLLLSRADRPGVFALKQAAGYSPTAEITAGQVAFGLAPRINAAGRIGLAEDALALLLAPDRETAKPLAESLDALNRERRRTEQVILDAALEQAKTQTHRRGLVLYDPEWHPGVIGIVASRVAEATYKPCLILTRENGLVKGSGRSITEFDLYGGLTRLAGLLARYGGHRQAAGLTLAGDDPSQLADAFDAEVVRQVGEEPLTPSLRVDAELPFSSITHRLLKELELLQPFGMGNPEPLFASPEIRITQFSRFGADHAKLMLCDETSGVTIRGKAWRMAERLGQAKPAGRLAKVAFSPRIDTYTGMPVIELNVKDFKLARSSE